MDFTLYKDATLNRMTNTAEKSAELSLAVGNNLGTLSTADLEAMHALCGRFKIHARELYNWLSHYIEHETNRRLAGDIAEQFEPELPRLDAGTWSDGALYDAVLCTYIGITSLDSSTPGAQKMLHAMHFSLLTWIGARIKRNG